MKQAVRNVLLVGSLFCASLGFAQTKPDAARGESLYMAGDMERGILACVACHGDKGNSVIAAYPHLAGLPEGYVVSQLKHFALDAQGKTARANADGSPTIMASIVAQMTDADRRDLAAYISKQTLSNPAFAKESHHLKVVYRGREIWRAGIPERNVPACASCHGAEGRGMPEQFPYLSGQHPEYIFAQLQAFANGYRTHGGVENMMGTIANRMDNADMKAVADYAAGLR